MATIESDTALVKPTAKRTMMVATESGRIYRVDFSQNPQLDDPALVDWTVSQSKILIGKFQLSRTRAVTLDEIEFETTTHSEQIPPGTTSDLQVTVYNSLDGRSPAQSVNPYVSIDEAGLLKLTTRLTGQNFSIQLRGVYNLNTVILTSHQNGRR